MTFYLVGLFVAFAGGFSVCALLHPDLRGLADEVKAHITSELNRIVAAVRR